MMKKAIGFALAGYAVQSRFNRKIVCLARDHRLSRAQFAFYVDDWDEEDDASGWRVAR